MINNKSELFAFATTRRIAEFTIDGRVFNIRSLTEMEREKLHEFVESSEKKNIMNKPFKNAKVIATCLVDQSGTPLFGDEDYKQITELDAAFVNKLAAACLEHIKGDYQKN